MFFVFCTAVPSRPFGQSLIRLVHVGFSAEECFWKAGRDEYRNVKVVLGVVRVHVGYVEKHVGPNKKMARMHCCAKKRDP